MARPKPKWSTWSFAVTLAVALAVLFLSTLFKIWMVSVLGTNSALIANYKVIELVIVALIATKCEGLFGKLSVLILAYVISVLVVTLPMGVVASQPPVEIVP